MAKVGRRVVFHGAFASKAKAVRKEKRRAGAYIIERKIRGSKRWVVLTDR